MYERHDEHGYLNTIFVQNVKDFIEFATEQETFQTIMKNKCIYAKCWNVAI